MIYYIGGYVAEAEKKERKCATPAQLKMEYVIDVIKNLDIELHIYSQSNYVGDSLLGRLKKNKIGERINISYPLLFSTECNIGKLCNSFLKKMQLFLFLLFKVRKEDVVIYYHSYTTLNIVRRLHSFKKFKWIAEIEEFYSYAWKRPEINASEIGSLMDADAYLCVNHRIAKYFEDKGKPVIISHGAYVVPPLFKKTHSNDEIHIVYAGTIERHKRGAFIAAETARYLSEKRKMHIIGFGKDRDINDLTQLINEINSSAQEIKVDYCGCMFGDDLFAFLQNCEIGFNSYALSSDFLNHCFPSKAITYIANNLLVVTNYAEVFESSELSSLFNFFYENSPREIAKVINSIDVNALGIDGREKVLLLHKNFIKDLKGLLEVE